MCRDESLREIERLNWTLTAIGKVNSALVRAETEHELYSAICEAVTFQNIFALAWIGIPVNDERKSVQVFTSAGKARPYLDGIDITWGDTPTGNGPTGRAIKSGQPQFNNNMLQNAQFSPWRERARVWNLNSSFCLPIKMRSGEVVSILMVYAEVVDAFGERELQFLSQLGDDIGYGVDALRTQKAYTEELQRREAAEANAHQHLMQLARVERIAIAQSLTTMLVHEINQPLGAILGNAQAAEAMLEQLRRSDMSGSAELAEILTDIQRDAQRAGEVVHNLRHLVTAQQPDMSDLCINDLIVATCDLVRRDLQAAAVSLQLQLAESLPRVRGSGVQFQQIFLNLIANARDALLSSAIPNAMISIKTQLFDRGSIAVWVSDNGPGIAAELKRLIAKPLFTTKSNGTGIGLWLCSQLASQYGGELVFENLPEGGASFCLQLPVACADASV